MSLFFSTSNRRSMHLARRSLATVTAAAVVASLFMATPAAALPIADVPANAADWATAPYSPLQPNEVAVPNNSLQLNFDGSEGGLNASGDVGTGFTMVQPSTADPEYYLPDNLQVADGSLSIAATKGIAYLVHGTSGTNVTKNQQDNTLGVGLNAGDNILRLTTTLKSPAGTTSAAQGGLWFGPSDDNYFKVVLASPSPTTRQIQLSREADGVTDQAADQVSFDSPLGTIGDQNVELILDIDAGELTASASYKIGDGELTKLGTLPLPEKFVDGTLLTTGVPGANTFGGIFATKRNMAASTPVNFVFQDFSVAELDAIAPAAPSALSANATSTEIDLAWKAPADADLAGYSVYRSETSPVDTTGTPLSGSSLLTDTTFTDTSAFIGSSYNYAVVAVDATGNTSTAAELPAELAAPEGTLVERINFQPVTFSPTPDGYTADNGLAYDATRAYGWITADDGKPFDFSRNTRDRGTSNPLLSTVIHMQFGDTANGSAANGVLDEKGVWEYNLPDGEYYVVAASGDDGGGISSGYDSVHQIRAEGVPVVDQFKAADGRLYDEGAAPVEVTDGKLTIDAEGGTNTKLNYIEIYEVSQSAQAPAAPANVSGSVVEAGVELQWDEVDGASGYNVFRGDTAEVAIDGTPVNGDSVVTGTSFTDEGVVADTTYFYAVVAVDGDGLASEASASAEVTVPADEPVEPGVCRPDQWSAEYFDGTELAGPVAHIACTETIDESYDWGEGPEGLDDDDFSIRWTKKVTEGAGTYKFSARTDDGVRIKVNNGLILNKWFGQSATETYSAVAKLAEGAKIEVEYYEGSGKASANVTYEKLDFECSADNWSADYYQGEELAGPVVKVDCAATIDQSYDWGQGPDGLDDDHFSIRWHKTVTEGAGTYKFTARTDDGVKIKVDDKVVLDKWFGQNGSDTYTVYAQLTESSKVEVEYFEGTGKATANVTYEKVDAGCAAGDWTAQYFQGDELRGPVVLADCVTNINQAFESGQGPDGVGDRDYSIRWTKKVAEGAGTYQFNAQTDDGVRIKVNGDLILDKWFPQSAAETHTVYAELSEGATVEVEYYQGSGKASANVSYQKLDETCPADSWSAEYFQGTELGGSVVKIDCVATIDEAYERGQGPEGVGDDNFSIRWSKLIAEAGVYEFDARTDDGVRIRIDGELILDKWFGQSANETYSVIADVAAGAMVEVEYFEDSGKASANVAYSLVEDTCTTGWSAQYFQGLDLAGPAVADGCVDTIDQAFASGEGPENVGDHDYSVRWSQTIAEGAGTYRFSARTDDGVRVIVDGVLILDKWFGQSATETHTAEVELGEEPARVVVEYFQGGGKASANVGYEKLGADTEAPDAPTQLVAEADESALNLSWNASLSTDTMGYHVYRGTETGVGTDGLLISGPPPAPGTSYIDVSAEPDVTYYYVVTAVDATGNESVVSNEAVGLITTVEDTEAPTAASALETDAGDALVALTWTASESEDAAGYHVYRSLQPDVATTGALLSGEALVAGTTYTDKTVANGTTYFYVVTAVDAAGNESEVSNEVFAVPRVPNATDIKVDFTETDGVPAAGYLADWGQSFGPRTSANQGSDHTYGWISQDGNPLSLVGNGRVRDRAGIDGRLDSILHMQYGDVADGKNGVNNEGIWELAVPDGLYEVTVAVGDQGGVPNGYDSVHAINIEAGVGIESFQATPEEEYRTHTTTVGIWDGALTLTAEGGVNTKISYVEAVAIEPAPHVDTMRPDNRESGHAPTDGVSATIRVPYAGVGVDPLTLPGNVQIYEAETGDLVPSSTGSSGGNDVISTQPDEPLEPNTQYRFVVTDGVKDGFGASFVPFTSVFTTGAGDIETSEEFTPLTGISFEKVELPIGANMYWASFAFGPDGKLYGSTIGQGLYRFTVNDDGTLSDKEDLGYQGRAIIGLVFDKSATASELELWITSTSADTDNERGEWISGISRLSGANLEDEAKIFEGLPRSLKDHLTNSMTYGPDGRLYFQQGSNQAAGDLDNAWGQRGEKLLTAATLVFDPAHPQVQAAASGGGPINVKTADGGTYNPYAADAPLKIYASGIRNAYDLVWHSNGHLYVPANGTAGGANSPGVKANADGTFTRVAAPGIPGFNSVNGLDVTDQCERRDYEGGSVPAIANHPTQRDHLYEVEEGGYYGHPNPERCEWVLHEGNDPANPPEAAGQNGSKYPLGVKADPNYRGIAWDLGFNKSPNGALEYKSDTFNGELQGRLIVSRFSNNNDLLFLQPDPNTGEILGEQVSTGIPGVANSTIGGVDGFNDPLEVVEDPNTGNLYVNQYDRSGSDQKMYLLRVPVEDRAATLTSSSDELVFSTVKNTTSAEKSVKITNSGPDTVTLASSITGAQPGEFAISGGNGTELSPGESVTIQVSFKPGSAVGQRSALLHLTAGEKTLDVGLYGLAMNGIEGSNEPPLSDVLGTLGYGVDVGWSGLVGGVDPAAKGEEVLEPLFVKSGNSPVGMTPLAQYAPREDLPYGWYTGGGTEPERHQVGSIDIEGYQSLLPPASAGSATSFDPGTEEFGFYYYSNTFKRLGFTEDGLNSGIAHRARIYPAENRDGAPMANSYIVAFEDASNGDYQDYVFLVQGVKPASAVTEPVGEGIKINFSNLAAALPDGYLRDFGQPFGERTRADQGEGLVYGWKSQATETPVDLSTAGASGLGNGRDRATSQPDQRLDTLIHMQMADVPKPNGNTERSFWDLEVPNGDYRVTVAAGDSTINTDPELHSINIENRMLIDEFVPSGPVGSDTHHSIATIDVTVADGLLTVDAVGGTNTKIDYIDIIPLEEVDIPGDDPTEGAQVKVNFQSAAAPTPTGWVADTGLAYNADRTFGWLVDGAPADRSEATRYRTGSKSGIDYPDDVLLRSLNLMGPADNVSTGVWEYDVPDGTYKVALSAGDSSYLDSTHGIAVEGKPLIASFVPTTSTPFQTGVREITVVDGKLTVTSTGTNSKINWISIEGAGLEGGEPTAPTLKYNFQTEAAPTPAGWIKDFGRAYSATTGFGWLVSGQPTDRLESSRHRTTATSGVDYPTDNVLNQTLNIMQGDTVDITNGVWERDLADGTYEVSLSVGDPGYLDSTHGIDVEGQPFIESFAPTGSSPFKTATMSVDVTDGRLTVVPTGSNTKINWITISGTNLADPAIAVTVNGLEVDSSFTGGVANISLAATAPTETTIESLTYSVNGAAAVEYTEPFTFETPGSYVLEVTATDSSGGTTSRTVEVEVLNIGGTLTLRNEQVTRQGGAPIPGMSEDWLVMQRINSGVTTHEVVDEATVTLSNTGTKDLLISELSLGGTHVSQFTVEAAPMPITLTPGASVPVTVKFVANSGGKGVRAAQLNIETSDPAGALKTVQLRGAYMTKPEGGNEISVNQVAQSFGWTTDLGSPSNGDEMFDSALNGEEVRSGEWKRMDSSKPVSVRQIAAFHGCCTATETVNVNGATATHNKAYGQSLLPLNNQLNGPTQLTTNPNGNFGIKVAGQSTTQTKFMAVKTWPVRDRDGNVVAGSWIVGSDYISTPNQCGTGPTNCDFQDNMYLISNILPVDSLDSAAPATVTGVVATANDSDVGLKWAASADESLAGYYVERAVADAGPWTRISGGTPLAGVSFTDANLPFASEAFYRVLAVDASGNVSAASATVRVDVPATDGQAIRINAGGGAVTTGDVSWLADTYFEGGKLYSNTKVTQIAGTKADVLYLSERSATTGPGSFAYNIPVPAGNYTVRLHFAEIYHGATGGGSGGIGKRVFSVNLEGGSQEVTNLDLNAEVGPMTAHIITEEISVTDGTLDIDFESTIDQPKVSAIEVISAP